MTPLEILTDLHAAGQAERLAAVEALTAQDRWTADARLALFRVVYQDPAVPVRLAALQALAERRSDETWEVLTERAMRHAAAYDPSAEVRRFAAQAVVDYAATYAAEALAAQRFVAEVTAGDYVPALLREE